MSARRVQAVLAAGVARPQLIDAWDARPEALRAHGVEPGAFDLAAVRKFAGFTAKVRHNGVRTLLPMSFRLMSEAGFEIELFASYASSATVHRDGYAGSIEERTARFVAFAQSWLDMRSREHVLLWDLLRHEHAISVLERRPAGSDAAAPASEAAASATDAAAVALDVAGRPADGDAITTAIDACRPSRNGEVLLFEMASNPAFVAAALAQRDGRWREAEERTRYYAYQRPAGSAGVRLAELDALGYYALAFIDGTRSVRELSTMLGGGDPPAGGFVHALRQLAQGGLIRLPELAP